MNGELRVQRVPRSRASVARPGRWNSRETLWVPPLTLLVRVGKVIVYWGVFACFMKELPHSSESLCVSHLLSQDWGRNRDKHICQREIPKMTISDLSFFMLQLYLTVTLLKN